MDKTTQEIGVCRLNRTRESSYLEEELLMAARILQIVVGIYFFFIFSYVASFHISDHYRSLEPDDSIVE